MAFASLGESARRGAFLSALHHQLELTVRLAARHELFRLVGWWLRRFGDENHEKREGTIRGHEGRGKVVSIYTAADEVGSVSPVPETFCVLHVMCRSILDLRMHKYLHARNNRAQGCRILLRITPSPPTLLRSSSYFQGQDALPMVKKNFVQYR